MAGGTDRAGGSRNSGSRLSCRCRRERQHSRRYQAGLASCNKLNTWNLLQQAKTHLDRARHLSLAPDRDWRHLYNQHYKITEEIHKRNADRAEQAMQDHLLQTVTDLNELKQQYPHYFKS